MLEKRGRNKLYNIYIYNNPQQKEELYKYILKTTKNIPISISKLDIKQFKENDILFIYEFKDLGSSTFKILKKLQPLIEKKIFLYVFKEKFNTIQYKNATKSLEAILHLLKGLEMFKKNLKPLGRPKKSTNKIQKLNNIQDELKKLREKGWNYNQCSKHFQLDPKTIAKYCKLLNI